VGRRRRFATLWDTVRPCHGRAAPPLQNRGQHAHGIALFATEVSGADAQPCRRRLLREILNVPVGQELIDADDPRIGGRTWRGLDGFDGAPERGADCFAPLLASAACQSPHRVRRLVGWIIQVSQGLSQTLFDLPTSFHVLI